MEEPRSYNLIRNQFGWFLLIIGALGTYFGLHDLLPGLDRPLTGEELRDGIAELSISVFWFANYFAGDRIPQSRMKYLGAVSVALIVVMIGLIVWD